MQEIARGFAPGFIGFGCLVRQRMNAPMHIRIRRPALVRDSIDHRIRLLCARGIIEVDQRLAIHLP